MIKLSTILFVVGFVFFGFNTHKAEAAACVAGASGNWSNTTTVWTGCAGGGTSKPSAGDTIQVNSGVALVVDENTLTVGAITVVADAGASGTNRAAITVSTGMKLTSSGLLTINGPTTSTNTTSVILTTTGALEVGSLTFGTGATNRNITLNVGTGTLTVNGAITAGSGGTRSITTSGAATLNFNGVTFPTGITYTVNAASTTNFTGTNTVSVGITWGIVEVDSGTTAFNASTNTVAGTTLVRDGATLNLRGFTTTFTGNVTVGGGTSGILACTAGVSCTGNKTFNSLTVNAGGVFDMTLGTVAPQMIFTGTTKTISHSGTTFNTGTGTQTISGTGALAFAGSSNMTFGNTVSIPTNRQITVSNTGGTGVTFSALTMATAATANSITINNGSKVVVTNALTFSANASATTQLITLGSGASGAGNLTVGSISMTGGSGANAGGGKIACFASATQTGTLTVSGAGAITITGSSTASNTGLMSIDMSAGGCNVITGTTATALTLAGGTTGASPAALFKMGTGTVTMNGALAFSGGTANKASFNMGASGGTLDLNVTGANLPAVGTAGSYTFTSTTNIISDGTSTISYATAISTIAALTVNSGTLTFSSAPSATSVTVASGATLALGGNLLTDTGNLTCGSGGAGTATISGSGGITLSGASAVLDDAGGAGSTCAVTNTGTFLVSGATAPSVGTGATFNISGTVSVSTVLTNNGTFSANHATSLSGAGNFINATNSVLNIAGSSTITTLTPAAAANDINYTGTAQTVHAAATNPYWDLGFTGSGANTIALPASITAISGILTLSGTASVTTGANLVVSGLTTIDTGATLTQGATFNFTTGGLTTTGTGIFTNTSTGDFTLGGNVNNAGTIILNSNNGSACVDGANDILVRSTVTNTLRSWSGAGTFTLRNLDVDDMTGSLTAENSVFSGDTTWTEACAVTVGNGTDGSDSTVGPDGAATEIDRFSLVVGNGTDTVTGMTVTLAGNASAYTNIATVDVQTTGGASKCSATPSSNTVLLTTCAISVTTSSTEYKILITPKTHAAMPAVPGASYATTATVTAVTAANSMSGTDSGSATITVDNASPSAVTSSTATGGDTQVSLDWTNPSDTDFTTSGTVVVLRRVTSAVADVPVEGTTYTVSDTIGTATVVCVIAGSPPTPSCADTGLTNGVVYNYKIFTQDSRGNYNAGTVPTGSPVTPSATALNQAAYRMFSNSNAAFGTAGVLTSAAASSYSGVIVKDSTYMYIGGYDSTPDWRIEKRLLSTGAVDNGFGTSGIVTGDAASQYLYDIAIDSTYMYAVGFNTTGDWRIEKRLLSTGAVDNGFGTSGVIVSAAASNNANAIVIDGTYMYIGGYDSNFDWRIEKRLLSTGAVDNGFGTSGVVTGDAASNRPNAINIDSTYMYVAGDNSTTDSRIEKRLLSTGAVDNGFGTSGIVTGDAASNTVNSIAIDSTYMYIVGDNSTTDWRIEKRLLSTGAVDNGFGTSGVVTGISATNYPNDIILDSNYMYITGDDGFDWRTEKRSLSNGALSTLVPPGDALVSQDTAGSLAAAGDAFRLRELIAVSGAQATLSSRNLKLQYALKSGTCDTSFSGETYADISTTTPISYYNNSLPVDGDTIGSTASDPTGGRTINYQTYEEANNFSNSVSAIPNGQDGLWDFSLYDNGATAGAGYCIRTVNIEGGGTLDSNFGTAGVVTSDSASLEANKSAADSTYLYTVGTSDAGDWRIEKRLLSTGAVDSGFGTSGVVTSAAASNTPYSISIDSTYMYVVGSDANLDWRIEKRLLSTGAVDNGFGTSGVVTADSVSQVANAIAKDSTYMYVVGYDNTSHARIEKRLLSTGAVDNGFGTSGVLTSSTALSTYQAIAIDSTYMYVAGYGNGYWQIEKRLLSTGAVDNGFGTSGVVTESDILTDTIFGIKIDATYMYVTGNEFNGGYNWQIEKRLLSTGAVDNGFGTSGVIIGDTATSIPSDIVIDSSYMYIVGNNSTSDWRIEKRLLSTGGLDNSFGTSGVVTSASGSLNAKGIVIDSNYMYVVGSDASDWRIEKRRINSDLDTYTVIPEINIYGVVSTTFTQSSYRFFNNTNTTDVGTALAAQNTAATLPGSNSNFRLRMLSHITGGSLSAPSVSASALTIGQDDDGNSTAVTASISPAANKLILLAVTSRTNITVDPVQPTVTGNGLTWVLVNDIVYDSTSTSRKRLSVFRAMGASPSAGAITVDWAGQAQTNIVWRVTQFSNMDTSGTNGSGAIVQSATNKDETVTVHALTTTLSAFASANNATYGVFASDFNQVSVGVGAGFTLLGNINDTVQNINIADEWKAGNDTSVDLTWNSVNASLGGVALEIKAATQTTISFFKLQYAIKSGTCDTAFSGETYADVTDSTPIAFNDNFGPENGAALTVNANDPTAGTVVTQTYVESNNFSNSQGSIPSGQDGLWDFSLYDKGVSNNISYCFRQVKSDGGVYDAYSQIPEIITAIYRSRGGGGGTAGGESSANPGNTTTGGGAGGGGGAAGGEGGGSNPNPVGGGSGGGGGGGDSGFLYNKSNLAFAFGAFDFYLISFLNNLLSFIF